MSNYSPIDGIIPQAIAETSTTQKLDLGTKIKANDRASTQYGQGEFIYASGAASTVVGSVVLLNPDDWSTTLAVADDKGILAISMSINVASSYGFYQISGKGVVKALTGFLDNADCYLTSTAGSIDDAVVSGDYIYGMKGASAVGTPSTDLAEVEIQYPSVRNAADANLADLGITATALEINQTATTSGRMVAAGSTLTITKALHNGATIKLDTLTGSVCTLPAATGTGAVYRFLITVVATSNSHIIKVANSSDTMQGIVFSSTDTTNLVSAWRTAASSDTITLNRSTTGSVNLGEYIEIMDIATNIFSVRGFTASDGVIATPFSATV